jgi:hypothetical protein
MRETVNLHGRQVTFDQRADAVVFGNEIVHPVGRAVGAFVPDAPRIVYPSTAPLDGTTIDL